MHCTNCGQQVEKNKKFCPNCGALIYSSYESQSHKTEEKNNPQKPPEINSRETAIKSEVDKEVHALFYKYLSPIILFISIGALIIYVILAEHPFSFTSTEQKVPQDVVTSSVVNILCLSSENEGEISGGSGTILTSDGVIITNSHVIPQDEENILTPEEGCIVTLPNKENGQPEETYWATPLVFPGLSDDYDLAYLTITGAFVDEDGTSHGTYPKEFPSILSEEHKYDDICQFSNAKLGDAVRIYGYPQTSGGFDLTVTEGVISTLTPENLILTSAKIDSGNSGGLAVNQKNCMVGIPVAVTTEGRYQNLGVIIPTATVLDFTNEVSEVINKI